VIGRFERRACTVGIPRIRRHDYAPGMVAGIRWAAFMGGDPGARPGSA
jgi:hypothetical protein